MNERTALFPASIWLVLFPIAFAVHFAEEFWCGEGYPTYLLRLRGVELSSERFVILQAVGFVLTVIACLISTRLKFPEFMIALLGGLFFFNGLSHSITALWYDGYGPGLFSSLFVWIPIGVLSLVRSHSRISTKRLVLAVLIGFAINGMVELIAARGGHLF